MFDFKAARQRTGLSIRKSATLMGINPKSLCDIENGKKKPSAKMVYRIAKQYNLPMEETLAATRGTIPGTLKWYREIKGLTLREVADKLYIAVKTIYSWEKGEHTPQIDLNPLHQLYGVSMDEIEAALVETKKEYQRKKGSDNNA